MTCDSVTVMESPAGGPLWSVVKVLTSSAGVSHQPRSGTLRSGESRVASPGRAGTSPHPPPGRRHLSALPAGSNTAAAAAALTTSETQQGIVMQQYARYEFQHQSTARGRCFTHKTNANQDKGRCFPPNTSYRDKIR